MQTGQINSQAVIAAVFAAKKSAPHDAVILEAYTELIYGSALSVTSLVSRMLQDPSGPANFGESLIITLYRRFNAGG